jgi:hypothetical protein
MKRQRYIEVPTTWDEMTEADWREVLKIRQKVVEHGGQYSELDITTETARMLLKNRGVKTQIKNPDYIQLVGRLAKTLGWLWHTEGVTISLVYKDTRNLIPKVREWLGPLDHGADLTFGEFRQAYAHLKNIENPGCQPPEACNNFRNTALEALAGLLYRPEASPEQKHTMQLRRQPYDWDSLDDKIERGRLMQPWQVWGIYAWFAYLCEYLTTGTFIIDGQQISFAPIFQTGDGKKGDGEGGMSQICLTLAESHVFGTAREVDRTPLMTVMQKLLMDYRTLMKLKNKK